MSPKLPKKPTAKLLDKLIGLDELEFNIMGLEKYCQSYQFAQLHKDLDKSFRNIAENFPDYSVITFQPEEKHEYYCEKYGLDLLQNSYRLRRTLEDKIEFRKLGQGKIKFADYEIVAREELELHTEKIVAQVPFSAGGEGTAILKPDDSEDLAKFLKSVPEEKHFLVSQFVPGRDLSVQCCTSKYGVLTTGINYQFIDDPALTLVSLTGHERFCGGSLNTTRESTSILRQIREITKSAGEILDKMNYKGVFGLDFRVSDSGEVFCIEMNARFTGMTQLIRMGQEAIGQFPLMLVHLLEHLSVDYEIPERDLQAMQLDNLGRDGSNGSSTAAAFPIGYQFIQHNTSRKPVKITNLLPTGTYKDSYYFVNYAADYPDNIVKPGERIFRVLVVG